MPIFDTYAYRKRLESRGSEAEVYSYDKAPDHMRHQISLALSEGIGAYYRHSDFDMSERPNANAWWEQIDRICQKELHSYLNARAAPTPKGRFREYLSRVIDVDDFLSAVELGCRVLFALKDDSSFQVGQRGAEQTGADAIDEINGRFEQHAVGYQFENNEIIRVDSKVVHAEVVKPALKLLSLSIFAKAESEFMTAHRHYRAAEYKDCVTAANRAYESAMKAICDTEQWEYGTGDRASDLVTRVTSKGLFTHDFDSSLTAYIAMLKTGLPAIRNRAGGHGEGLLAAAVTRPIARFAINLTAANIVFLGESYDLMKGQQGK